MSHDVNADTREKRASADQGQHNGFCAVVSIAATAGIFPRGHPVDPLHLEWYVTSQLEDVERPSVVKTPNRADLLQA
jgi:hypothetical protein